MATQQEKQALVNEIAGHLGDIETALDVIVANIVTAHNYGMISKPERDSFTYRTRAHNMAVKWMHADMTEIAVRENVDIQTAGPGR